MMLIFGTDRPDRSASIIMLRQFQQTFSYEGIGQLGDGPDGICPLPANSRSMFCRPHTGRYEGQRLLVSDTQKIEFASYLSRCFRSRTHYTLWLRAFSVLMPKAAKAACFSAPLYGKHARHRIDDAARRHCLARQGYPQSETKAHRTSGSDAAEIRF